MKSASRLPQFKYSHKQTGWARSVYINCVKLGYFNSVVYFTVTHVNKNILSGSQNDSYTVSKFFSALA
jgi:hypothetical protein